MSEARTKHDWMAPLIERAVTEGRDYILLSEAPQRATMLDVATLMLKHPEVERKITMRKLGDGAAT